MSGPEGEERLQGSRGERRFSALNPHGNVDFVLPSGGVSEYLGKSTSINLFRKDLLICSVGNIRRPHQSRELLVRPQLRSVLVGRYVAVGASTIAKLIQVLLYRDLCQTARHASNRYGTRTSESDWRGHSPLAGRRHTEMDYTGPKFAHSMNRVHRHGGLKLE
jgi:hypothetical protein